MVLELNVYYLYANISMWIKLSQNLGGLFFENLKYGSVIPSGSSYWAPTRCPDLRYAADSSYVLLCLPFLGHSPNHRNFYDWDVSVSALTIVTLLPY